MDADLIELVQHRVEKPWGQIGLPAPFHHVRGDGPIGEIWFQPPGGITLPLLVKYLFTSEKLSIQVHPDDVQARVSGHPHGKDEAWLVLAAEPGATLGIGLQHPLSDHQLRRAAQDGSIEDLVIWHPAQAGDVYYSPAGMIHAIGAGLVLLEVQQNLDLTYRLYDYGRHRELHLDEGIAAADSAAVPVKASPQRISPNRDKIAAGPAFSLERWRGAACFDHAASPPRPLWLIPLAGQIAHRDETLAAGSVWLATAAAALDLSDDADLIVAMLPNGPEVRERG